MITKPAVRRTTYYAKSKAVLQKDAYTYNLKHETYTYGAGMKS